ncbi:MAG: agmatine deiminase AguA [Idiomarinaceae bacterium HL-53]|nr:MAG: agmatine deiminase AguA [Idiomarinaceae bacterium HL-53]CUS48638.1 agmatine deiminase [Idiomarinaceae bacterium HL-53]
MAMLLPEWHPAKSLWLRWPYRQDIWPHEGVSAQAEVLKLCELLAAHNVAVQLMVTPEVAPSVREKIENQSMAVQVHSVTYGDVWLRDCAPLLTDDGILHHFDFDGWGGIDDRFAADLSARNWLSEHLLSEASSLRGIREHEMVLEGGAIQTDGQGTAILCSGSILHRTKNQEYSVRDFEARLCNILGLQKILWLPGSMSADETGGHVDNMACYLAPGVVAINKPIHAAHADTPACDRVRKYLQWNTDAAGNTLTLVELPLPEAPRLAQEEAGSIQYHEGVRRRLPGMPLMASYLNFIRIGNIVVLPAFHCESDAQALQLMKAALPECTVLQSPCRAMLAGGGAWHCASWVEAQP